MQRTFLRNLALVLVLNLLVKPFYILGIDAGVQVRVGAATYGSYAALLSLSFLLNILLDLGITNYNTRHIARNMHLMRAHLGGILAMRLVLVGLYAVATLLAGLVLGYTTAGLELLAWLVLNQALAGMLLYLRSNIAAAQRFAQDSLLSVLDRVLLIAICGWLLWGRATGTPFRIEWFVRAQTVSYATAVIVAFLLVRGRTGRIIVRWSPGFSWGILRQSFPYALLILLMTFYYRTDTVMLERMLPDGPLQAGIYAQAFRFFEALNMLGYLLAGLLLPMFSRMLKQGDDVGPLTGLAFRLVWVGTLWVAVVGITHAHAVMALRYTEHVAVSAPVFALLLICFMAVCTTYVFGTLLTANGDLRALNTMAAAGMVVNIALNAWLIPGHQALGAAWASLVTQVATALVQMVLVVARFRWRIPVGRLFASLSYAILLVGIAWGSMRWGMGLLPFALLMGVSALVLAFLTRTVTWAELRSAMRRPVPAAGTEPLL
ncbi:MAG: oligosaccharide flippase family protein [Flavobacteriales bacterium]|nr:oligosaccharide flippase family protein [Flavobacteriales bacterium]